jgi:hypothetical protein
MNYNEIRSQLKTLDILNFEAKDLFWRAIGHTAVVYKDPLTGMLWCFESTSRNKLSGISGVQITPLGARLDSFSGKVFVRQIHIEPDFVLKDTPGNFIKKYRGTSYPDLKSRKGRLMLILSALDIYIGDENIATYKGEEDWIFCTMLVVMLYRWCGLMDDHYPPSREFEPDDTRNNGKIDRFLIGCTLDKEIQIK